MSESSLVSDSSASESPAKRSLLEQGIHRLGDFVTGSSGSGESSPTREHAEHLAAEALTMAAMFVPGPGRIGKALGYIGSAGLSGLNSVSGLPETKIEMGQLALGVTLGTFGRFGAGKLLESTSALNAERAAGGLSGLTPAYLTRTSGSSENALNIARSRAGVIAPESPPPFKYKDDGPFAGPSLLRHEEPIAALFKSAMDSNIWENGLGGTVSKSVLQSRYASLDGAIRATTRGAGLPVPQLYGGGFEGSNDLARYSLGHLRLGINPSVVATADREQIARSVTHELTHLEQDVLITSAHADRLGIGAKPTANQLKQLKSSLDTSHGYSELPAADQVQIAALKSILEARAKRPELALSPGELKRAKALETSFREGIADQALVDKESKAFIAAENDWQKMTTIGSEPTPTPSAFLSDVQQRATRGEYVYPPMLDLAKRTDLAKLAGNEKLQKSTRSEIIGLILKQHHEASERVDGALAVYRSRLNEHEAHTVGDRIGNAVFRALGGEFI